MSAQFFQQMAPLFGLIHLSVPKDKDLLFVGVSTPRGCFCVNRIINCNSLELF